MQQASAKQQQHPGTALSVRQLGPDGRDTFDPSHGTIAIDDAYAAGREGMRRIQRRIDHEEHAAVADDDAARQRCDLHYDQTPVAVIGVGVTARVIRPADLHQATPEQPPRAGEGAELMLSGVVMAVMLVLGVMIGAGVVSMMWMMASRGGGWGG